jgi:hypothetical protein
MNNLTFGSGDFDNIAQTIQQGLYIAGGASD